MNTHNVRSIDVRTAKQIEVSKEVGRINRINDEAEVREVPMGIWYSLECKNSFDTGKLRSKLRNAGIKHAVESKTITVVTLNTSHGVNFLQGLADQYKVIKRTQATTPKTLIPAPCGTSLTKQGQVKRHLASCNSCIRLKENEVSAKRTGLTSASTEPSIIGKVGPEKEIKDQERWSAPIEEKVDLHSDGIPYDMQPLPKLIRQVEVDAEKAINVSIELESLATSLTALSKYQSELQELEESMAKHKEAIRKLTGGS